MAIDIRYCRRWLGRQFPTRHRVYVVRRSGKVIGKDYNCAYCHGDTRWFVDDASKEYAVIRLAAGDSLTVQIEALLHEWAHVLVGHIPDWKTLSDPDSPVFNAMEGEIRRAWLAQAPPAAVE